MSLFGWNKNSQLFEIGHHCESSFKCFEDSGMSWRRDDEDILATFSNDGRICLRRRTDSGQCYGSDFSDERNERDYTFFGTYKIVSVESNIALVDVTLTSLTTNGKDCTIYCQDSFNFIHENSAVNLSLKFQVHFYPRKIMFFEGNQITTRKEFITNS